MFPRDRIRNLTIRTRAVPGCHVARTGTNRAGVRWVPRGMSTGLHVELRAEPGAAGRSRRAASRWFTTVCGGRQPCEVVSDLVLAVNEAVSNSIEHAYRDGLSGTVVLHADVDRPSTALGGDGATVGCPDVRVTVRVSDRGSWREPALNPGHRGRGLSMIRACAEDVVVTGGPSGTTVTFHGRLSCPAHCSIPA